MSVKLPWIWGPLLGKFFQSGLKIWKFNSKTAKSVIFCTIIGKIISGKLNIKYMQNEPSFQNFVSFVYEY